MRRRWQAIFGAIRCIHCEDALEHVFLSDRGIDVGVKGDGVSDVWLSS